MNSFCLLLRTRGGVQDLGRVVNVLALLDLTPVAFNARAEADRGLQLRIQLAGDDRAVRLCLGRLRALPAITEARLETDEATACV